MIPDNKSIDWQSLLVTAARPSVELSGYREAGLLAPHPELLALVGCAQDPAWHPEGDAWEHTLLSLDFFASERVADEREDFLVGLAVLCHDLGKPSTSDMSNERIISHGHEEAGESPARAFLTRIGVPAGDIEEIVPLIIHHMRPELFYKAKSGDKAIRRLGRKVGGRMDRLVRVARADKGGRGRSGELLFPAGDWILERWRESGSNVK